MIDPTHWVLSSLDLFVVVLFLFSFIFIFLYFSPLFSLSLSLYSSMSVTETFHGYIETTQDSLLVFEACRRNILPKVSRRLQERERRMARSGSVFVFDEKDSGKYNVIGSSMRSDRGV